MKTLGAFDELKDVDEIYTRPCKISNLQGLKDRKVNLLCNLDVDTSVIDNCKFDKFWLDLTDVSIIDRIDDIKSLLNKLKTPLGLRIRLEDIDIIRRSKFFKRISSFMFSNDEIGEEKIQTLYFIGKTIVAYLKDDVTNEDYQCVLVNPIVESIIINDNTPNESLYYEITKQSHIKNNVIHINVKEIIDSTIFEIVHRRIIELVAKVFGYFLVISITNLPDQFTNEQITKIYRDVAFNSGSVLETQPVNGSKEKVISRDIKYTPNIKSYYASNIRQPLHTDYAHYPSHMCRDWLMLFALKKSEYGGITSLVHSHKLVKILKKYNRQLFKKVMNTTVIYKFTQDDESIIHEKILINDELAVNWNINQISDDNSKITKDICKEFFEFMEKMMVDGQMFDVNKQWERGDCIIFNDHFNLHCRSAFYGDRWLKDFGIIDNRSI